jgi:hypothetical protein
MRNVLHILTKTDQTLAAQIIKTQGELPEVRVQVVDLTKPDADYQVLLEVLFEAGSVQVW